MWCDEEDTAGHLVMEESGADHDIAMEGSKDLFIGSCSGTGESETNDQVFQQLPLKVHFTVFPL